jgi:mannan endo-1,4-beta-mannosidase
MCKKKVAYLFAFVFLWTGLAAQTLSDKNATKRTRKLYANMVKMVNDSSIMFGHQDDLAYGIGWKYVKGASDVHSTLGEYPSVFGWDLGLIELDSTHDLDGVPFDKMRGFIKDAYKMGAISTLSWHLRNPATGGTAWDTTAAVTSILVGGAQHTKFMSWVDKVADFALSLKAGFWGKKIPIIFRPFHEHTGKWFWWGDGNCTAEDYKTLWRMTVDRLRARGVDNFIYAYSPDNFKSKEHYLDFYPGDDYVDILGHDLYHHDKNPDSASVFINKMNKNFKIISEIAQERKKVMAFTETGLETVSMPNWWTEVLWQGIKDYKLAYVLVWRNGRPDHYYAPYPSQKSAVDFQKFSTHQRVLFSKKAKELNLYK